MIIIAIHVHNWCDFANDLPSFSYNILVEYELREGDVKEMNFHCLHCCYITQEEDACPACGQQNLIPIHIEVHSNQDSK